MNSFLVNNIQTVKLFDNNIRSFFTSHLLILLVEISTGLSLTVYDSDFQKRLEMVSALHRWRHRPHLKPPIAGRFNFGFPTVYH
jgi:hypothetical protein